MSHVIGRCDTLRKPGSKFVYLFQILTGALLGFAVLVVYSRTHTVVAMQDQQPGARAQMVFVPRISTSDGPRVSEPASLDISQLIRECDRQGTAMHARLPEYTYIQTRVLRELDERGKLSQHINAYEAYPIIIHGNRRHIISQISENGSPISPKRLKQERQKAAKEIESAERDGSPQFRGTPSPSAERYVSAGIGLGLAGEGVWIGVSQFLRQCHFGAPRYDRLSDRNMIALDIDSCQGNVTDPRELYLTRISGVVWIDPVDKVVARLEAWPKKAATNQNNDSEHQDSETIVYEQMRLPNGLWVPKRIRLNAIGKAALFNGTDKDMTFEFSQYQRFNIEVEDLQRTPLKSNP